MKKKTKGTKPKKVTIYDVARLAGVSPGTASRALNSMGYVKQETLEKVQESAKALDYIPNSAGRSLKTTKTGLICLAIPDNSNPIYFKMIQGVQKVASRHGYSMLLYHTNGLEEAEERAMWLLRNNTVDGLMLINFWYSDKLRELVQRSEQPVVLCGMCDTLWAGDPENTFDTISINMRDALYRSTAYAIGRGHKDIVLLAGKAGLPVYLQRFEGYRKALEEHGIPYNPDNVFWHGYDEVTGRIAARHFLEIGKMPEAVCAANDLQAIGYFKEMMVNGIDARKYTDIVGVDNVEMMELLRLPSVNIHEEEVGEQGAELIFQRMNSGGDLQPRDIYFETQLVLRPEFRPPPIAARFRDRD